MIEDPYKILGVSPDASDEEIVEAAKKANILPFIINTPPMKMTTR